MVIDESPLSPLPRHAVHRLFERAARRFPDHVAVECGSVRCTYREMLERAHGLAGRLLALGLPRGAFVGIFTADPVQAVAAMLGILRAGCAFVPLDVDLPDARLSELLAEIDPACMVSEHRRLERLATARPAGRAALRVLRSDVERLAAPSPPGIEEHLPLPAGGPDGEALPEVEDDPEGRCYVYFTSGSTGRPKGIVGRLKAIGHFIRWEVAFLGLGEGARVALLTTPAFDAYLRIFMPLAVGGTFCAPAGREVILDAARLVDWLDRERIEVMHCVPTLFRSILGQQPEPARFPALRHLLMAGERLLPADVARWHATFGDRVQLVNLYGPTETTITKFCYVVQPADGERRAIPIGKPIPGCEAVALDSGGRPCARGVVGEICIRTPFRAHGYLNRPDLDREAFMPNPLGGDPGDLLYRTGDFGRVSKDGDFEYLGRRDQQVKIRGVRVELGEVEETLRRHPGVRDLAAVAREDAQGDTILCAYVCGEAAEKADELRELCARSLPPAMVPSVFVPMAVLPRTLSGKVDRRALPEPEEILRDAARRVEPRDELERTLAAIWAEVLGREAGEIGVDDNFFQLGGHSLTAILVLARIMTALEIDVPARLLFQHPTIAALAPLLTRARADKIAARPAGEEPGAGELPPLVATTLEKVADVDGVAAAAEAAPLSYSQQRLWFIDQLEPGSPFYNLFAAVTVDGGLDEAALRRALAALIERQSSLRTVFATVDGEPRQIVRAAAVGLRVVDLRHCRPQDEDGAELRRLVAAAAAAPFDLGRGPLLRCLLMRLGERRHVLAVTLHHIVADAWSMAVFIRELVTLYHAAVSGQPSPLPPLPVRYADFAVWQRRWLAGEVLKTQVDHWRRRIAGAPALLQLPYDRPRPARQTYRGAQRHFSLPAATGERLAAVGQSRQCTLFMTLLAVWNILLHRLSGETDLVVGAPIAYRNWPQIEELIGFFINILSLRTDLSGDPSVGEVMRRVREETLAALTHQHLPFDMLVEELRPERNAAYNPIFQVAFNMIDQPAEAAVPDLVVTPFPFETGLTQFDLVATFRRHAAGLDASLRYSTDLFSAETIAWIEEQFRWLLTRVADGVDLPLSQLLRELGESERERWSARRAALGGEGGGSLRRRRREAMTGDAPPPPAATAGNPGTSGAAGTAEEEAAWSR